MSQADRVYSISLDAYDAATLALNHAIAMLHCVQCAGDPENQNRPAAKIVQDALDGATGMIEQARDHLTQHEARIIHFPTERPSQ